MLPAKIKRILLDPDPRLRAPNAEVTESWGELQPWVRLMFKAMYRGRFGVGLAAPQVGWNVRLFVMNPDDRSYKPELQRVFWNPTILERAGQEKPLKEGCLSLPGVFGFIPRWSAVRLQANSPDGLVDEWFDGFTAEIVQHEVDHLGGKLCFDHWVPVEGKAGA